MQAHKQAQTREIISRDVAQYPMAPNIPPPAYCVEGRLEPEAAHGMPAQYQPPPAFNPEGML